MKDIAFLLVFSSKEKWHVLCVSLYEIVAKEYQEILTKHYLDQNEKDFNIEIVEIQLV